MSSYLVLLRMLNRNQFRVLFDCVILLIDVSTILMNGKPKDINSPRELPIPIN